LRLLLIVDPRYFVFFCGSEGVVMKCIWEDDRFLFSVYSKNFTLVRVKLAILFPRILDNVSLSEDFVQMSVI